MQWYPLKLTVHIRTYAFGARQIPELLGKMDVPDGTVAETWEVSDYRNARATITNGAFAGQLLHEAVEAHADDLVGEGWRGPHFPLLEKFIDASSMVPVHLHADDETARRLYNEPNGKSEAWHILWAAPGATMLAGVKPNVAKEQLRSALRAKDYDSVMPRFPISSGDTVYVPGGILHAFGPDTLIFEVQQTSDLAQSVMPTDLFGNPLTEEQWETNIKAALAELRTHYLPRPNPGLRRLSANADGNKYVVGCAGPYFALERWSLSAPHREPAHPKRCVTLSNVGGPMLLTYEGGEETLGRAESCIVPAAIGEVTITPTLGAGDLVVCYVPDIERDVIEPLRVAGHTQDAIRTLGEVDDYRA
jgi:mannose-6-phosphate isomerase